MTCTILVLILGLAAQAATPWKEPLAVADALYKAGLIDDAVLAFDKLITSYPTLAAAHLGLGNSLVWKGDKAGEKAGLPHFRRAETHFRRAIDLALDAEFRREALYDLAISFAINQPTRLKNGLAIFDEIVKQRPDDVVVHLARARVLFTQKTMPAYVTAMKTVRDRFPQHGEVRWTLGMALRDNATVLGLTREGERRRLLTEAVAEFDRALAVDPVSEMAVMYKALALRDLGFLEADPAKAAALEAESKRLLEFAEKLRAKRGGGT